MKLFFKILFYVTAALYPVLIFTFLVILKLPVRILSLCIVGLALAFFIALTGKRSDKKKSSMSWKPMVSALLFMTAGIVCFLTNQTVFLKLYSVVISAMLLIVFSSTLFFGPNIIFRFALMGRKPVKNTVCEKMVEAYCKKVCIVWCFFFIINGSISVCTAFSQKLFGLTPAQADALWSVYNGGIFYVLMGILFTVEYIIRKMVDKKMPESFAFTKFKSSSRPDDFILCYEDKYSSGSYKTWKDFLIETSRMRNFLTSEKNKRVSEWILHCEDYWYFLVTFASLLQCKKTVHLTQNITESFLCEIKKDGYNFLTDQNVDAKFNADFIPDVIAETAESEDFRTIPSINNDDTQILMYTSGSTGKPKAVHQRMTEFEADNAFIISRWARDFLSRRLVTTVSQHHIYGFLFGISLPFSLGVPFRRKRIEFPEEFESLTDDKYIIIATPAFLKRTVEVEEKLPLDDCFIFTSGGACSPELSKKTLEVFGFCPLEVYGSTETSGIAYRQQSKDGLYFTPFDNAKIWKGEDGCLRIISPYIKDPEGFATADLVEIFDDGRFLLKGRSDSIVKIEEKRISMTEVENRILETKLVRDVKVVALEDRRQYLAAAIELNDEGMKKFEGQRKLVLNNYFHDFLTNYFENVVIPKKWRFVEKLPVDVQGKKHKDEIVKLFEKSEQD
ncbi:acyl-CoA synthetase [Treponema rectale]|uniref:Acyl-CoA synthetase n=1 Tax=Treponema rectale TaxID=744512 RepID=A0A840SEA7_9SPIR|nr:AMP-binding protein [Treponema rectale]MBB5217771.1 acyl-coenzyme A synthetase/AMP-(fatty) acid ligase [Treponema rectale]QOS40502.1 acyl-CoA synthetase [Treponema rectale]